MAPVIADRLRYELASALLKHRKILSVSEIAAIPPEEQPDSVRRVVDLLLQALPVRKTVKVFKTPSGYEWEDVLVLSDQVEAE